MSFPAYPEYKPSGFDWLPEVPAHWVDRKIARDIPFVVGWTPPSGKDEYYDGDLPWVTIADMTQMSVEDTKSKISHLAVQDKGAKVVPAGSMLFSFKLSVGKIAFLTIDSYTNEAIAGFLPCGPLDLEYWKYAAPEFIPRYGRENIYGATLLNQELISSVRFSAPARAEQTKIARFLDHETARIDALIEEQLRLIELLKEKRQAVISHAVTKGLDPTVPMKDSGVEWLGEVPAHWEVTRLRRICVEINDINHVMPVAVESGVPFLSAKDLFDDGTLNFTEDVKMISESDFMTLSKKICPRRGDIIYSRIGACLGKARLVETDERFLVSYSCCVVRVVESIACPRFIQHLLDGEMILTEARMRTQGIGVPDLGLGEIGRFPIALPPVTEQQQIARYLDDKAGKFATLTAEAKRATTLLQEHRSALISAAVTGKIDVRGWQPPANAKTPELEQEAV